MRHTVRLSEEISTEARRWAAADGESVNNWIAAAVQRECTRRALNDLGAGPNASMPVAAEHEPLD